MRFITLYFRPIQPGSLVHNIKLPSVTHVKLAFVGAGGRVWGLLDGRRRSPPHPPSIFHHYPPYRIPFETFWDISHKTSDHLTKDNAATSTEALRQYLLSSSGHCPTSHEISTLNCRMHSVFSFMLYTQT